LTSDEDVVQTISGVKCHGSLDHTHPGPCQSSVYKQPATSLLAFSR